MDEPPASVVVLTYNSRGYIVDCLESLRADSTPGKEILLVDNASKDGTVDLLRERYPDLPLIANAKNRGVAAGWNQGWRRSRAPFVAFVNPDMTFDSGWLEALLAALQADPQAAVAGAKLLYPGGRIIQHAGAGLLDNGQSYHRGCGEIDRGQYDEPGPAEYVTGAAMLVRRDALEALGGFDEDYFPAYYEDSDFCVRVWRSGRKVLYVPSSRIIHYESVTLTIWSWRFVWLSLKMRSVFVGKHYGWRDMLFRFLPRELGLLFRDPGFKVKVCAVGSYYAMLPPLWKRLLGKLKQRAPRRGRIASR
ncbi:MAG: N-acetylglucosaminyl-diphospho-decaprenol L-rhamnosyltransferase [candidate division BRC1 bacterium ADurb.BinA364]|nr:MAG: N-acetylglucosaminyl-diphospho-decaprenol L-rhamnosyltransferase [candidate division BRC1 bacterium ADurb.BinA364]